MPKQCCDYSNTVIYKIVCKDLNIKDIYIGSTTNFIKRKCHHKTVCNNPTHKLYNLFLYRCIRENGGWANWEMIELEKLSCQDRNEATRRERYYYEELKGNLNKNVPNRSIKEYLHHYQKSYRIDYKKLIHSCECGSIIKKYQLYQHNKTNKHLAYINNKDITQDLIQT